MEEQVGLVEISAAALDGEGERVADLEARRAGGLHIMAGAGRIGVEAECEVARRIGGDPPGAKRQKIGPHDAGRVVDEADAGIETPPASAAKKRINGPDDVAAGKSRRDLGGLEDRLEERISVGEGVGLGEVAHRKAALGGKGQRNKIGKSGNEEQDAGLGKGEIGGGSRVGGVRRSELGEGADL
jgi:hypothetical protein